MKSIKKMVSAVLSLMLLVTVLPIASAVSEDVSSEVVFHDLAELEAAIESLYNGNYPEIAQKIKEMRGGSFAEMADEVLTLYYGSCGPTSIAFQKVLIDNNIYAETRMDSQMYSAHEYNLLRTRFEDGTVKFVLFDGAYRQFMRDYFKTQIAQETGKQPYEVTDSEVDAAILATGLPNVLIFDFSNKDEAIGKIKAALGEDVDASAYDWIDNRYESQPYPEPALQTIHTRYLTDADVARLETGISFDRPFESKLYLRGSWDNYGSRSEIKYMGNGVYQFDLMYPEAQGGNGTFTVRIEDESGAFVYGTTDTDAVYPTMKATYNHTTKQWFLTDDPDSGADIPINTYGGNVTLRLDTRAGVHSPHLRMLNLGEIGIYGDINYDGIINTEDTLKMRNALSGLIDLDSTQLLLCDVNADGSFTEADIELVQKYIALYPGTGRVGETAYMPVE